MTRSRRALLVVGMALAVVSLPSSVAVAAEADVGTETEAWFRTTPTCPATACPPIGDTPSEYPADTLHVAVTSGQETARTYVTFDLSSLPEALISGGTLQLPVAGADAGTLSAESAQLQVCLVSEPVQAATGSVAAPPATTCGISAAARYVPASAESSEPAMFVADVARFVDAWRSGNTALAIVPAVASKSPTATWHVAFNGRERESDDLLPITASVTYGDSASPVGTVAPPAVRPPATPTSLDLESLRPVDSISSGRRADVAAPATSGEIVAALGPDSATVQPIRRVASSSGFRYQAIFYLPLVLLVAGALLARAFTRPITAGRA